MNKRLSLILTVSLIALASAIASPQAEEQVKTAITNIEEKDDLYGASAASEKEDFTLEEMMKYAIEDERLAFAEYNYIIEEFNVNRPFSNIVKAEATHESLLLDLYEQYDMEVPSFDGKDHVVLPSSLKEIYEVGVEAEIANIAMYDKFLSQDLDADVRSVFERLKDGSVKHLASFNKQLDRFN